MAAILVGHHVSTTEEMGWQDLSNGKLLALAASGFDVFLTVDKGLLQQQNLTDLAVSVVVQRSRSNSISALARHAPGLLSLLDQSLQSRVYVLDEPEGMRDRK